MLIEEPIIQLCLYTWGTSLENSTIKQRKISPPLSSKARFSVIDVRMKNSIYNFFYDLVWACYRSYYKLNYQNLYEIHKRKKAYSFRWTPPCFKSQIPLQKSWVCWPTNKSVDGHRKVEYVGQQTRVSTGITWQ
jgi:hypothetical protein